MDDLFAHLRYRDGHPHIGALFMAWAGGGKEKAAHVEKSKDYPGAYEDFCAAWGTSGGEVR